MAAVTLNRADHLNTFNTPMAEELFKALVELDADDRVNAFFEKRMPNWKLA